MLTKSSLHVYFKPIDHSICLNLTTSYNDDSVTVRVCRLLSHWLRQHDIEAKHRHRIRITDLANFNFDLMSPPRDTHKGSSRSLRYRKTHLNALPRIKRNKFRLADSLDV